MRLEFGEFVIDLEQHGLTRAGEPVKLEPKVFDVLHHLVVNRDRVVPKEELLRTLWPGEHVIDGVVTRCVYALRKALEQDDADGAPLSTVRGRGYRFTADVKTLAPSTTAASREPLVGRDEEMTRLRRALASARAGRGRIVWLVGDPGIGKTRLADEIADIARTEGVGVWVARCHEHEGAPPFWAWTQVARACLAERPDAEVRRTLGAGFDQLGAIVPELASPARTTIPPPDAGSEHAAYRLFDAVTSLVRLATAKTPHLLVLDDLHWADAPSMQLLGFVAPEIAAWSLCVVATAREAEWGADDPRRASLAQLATQRAFERMEPPPLGARAVGEYVTGVLGRPSQEIAEALHRTSEGNAFFMVEALRSRAPDAETADATHAHALPAAIKDVVARRLARLPEVTREALHAASVVGRAFDVRVVAHALALDASATLAALEPATAARLLVRAAEHHGRFAFGHGLVRETLYASLSATRRAALHARIAAALERAVPPPLAEIAQHFLRALPDGDPAKAVDYARRAGNAAAAVHAHDAAAISYGDALAALDQAPDIADSATRHALLIARGQACRMAGRRAEATEAFLAAADQARRIQRPTDLAHAAIGLRDCESSRAVPDPTALALLDEALEALPEDALALRARLLSRLAAVRAHDQRRTWSERAHEVALASGDPTAQADALRARLHALQRPDEIAQRLAVADELVALAERQRQPAWTWEARLARYDAHLRLGNMREADLALDSCAALAEDLRHPLLRMEVERHRMQRALCSGRYDEAEEGIASGAETAARLQSRFSQFYFSAQRMWFLRDKKMLHTVENGGDRFVQRHPWAEATSSAAVGIFHFERGNLERAKQCFAYYAERKFDNVPEGEDRVAVLAHLGELCILLGELQHAPALRTMLAPYAAQNVVNGPLLYLGSAMHYLGLLDAAMGDVAHAKENFDAALVTNTRLGAFPALMRTREAYADLLAKHGDAKRAATLAQEAAALRTELKLPAR